MYLLETRTRVLSMHLTRRGAQDALRRYWLKDRSGVTASVTKVPNEDFWYAGGSILVFVAIGVMLAWRG
jgi:hypothetical protein